MSKGFRFPRKKRARLKVGDIFKIPLDKKKHSYGQYYMDHPDGPIMRVFNIVTTKELKPEEIIKHDLMFPPIFTGLHAAIRAGYWGVVGHCEIKNFKPPKFKASLFGPLEKDNMWFLIEGTKEVKIGKKLPKKYKDLEMDGVWSAFDVVKRIKNKGRIPYKAWE